MPPKPPPEGVEDTPTAKGVRPLAIVREMRIRTIELMMLRATAEHAIFTHASSKWGISADTTRGLINEIKARWREEWRGDQSRIDARNRAIKSMEYVISKLHEIISATRTVESPHPTDPTKRIRKTFYTHGPRERIAAMATLAKVEVDLGKITGHSFIDVPLAPPKPIDTGEGQPPAVPAPVMQALEAPGSHSLGNQVQYTEYFRQVKMAGATAKPPTIDVKAVPHEGSNGPV